MKIGSHDTAAAVFVIAEIGNNHEGDFDLALELVSRAADAGADAVKFQTIVPERLVSVQDQKRIEQLRKFQFAPEQFQQLREHSDACGVEFLSTPFDIATVDWLDELVPAWKVASSDNDFFPLLDRVAATGKPVIISMGLGHHTEAPQLLNFFRDAWARHGVTEGELALLHCVVSYPTPDDEAALGQIGCLKLPGVTPGYSDHTLGIKAAELAVAAGARIIEKHFTVNKNHSEFRDHQLSADPEDLRQMVYAIRHVERMMGKQPGQQSCEASNRDAVRRSLSAAVDLPAGATLTMEQLVWVRPGTGIRPGQESMVVGKRLIKAIRAGEPVLPEHVVDAAEVRVDQTRSTPQPGQ